MPPIPAPCRRRTGTRRTWSESRLTAETLTFAVFGDNRRSTRRFLRLCSKQVDHDPGLSFAIHLGDMVKKADLDKYRELLYSRCAATLHKPLLIGDRQS